MSVDDSRPIWIQLVDTFSHNIVTGKWPAGSQIPSVRELAIDAGVNPNTIQRSLSQLDTAGLTVTERTQGRFVTSDLQKIARKRSELAARATSSHIATMVSLGIGPDEAIELIREGWKNLSTHKGS
ncbi:GntR family transcriptional regulator [Arcanobacterium pinnipediorum]|uniref:GntR family transcriptional regulator n=1 Tax=Arcanobacterium pinnipediorum TaxID=1503041 RepID=A0ABY5AFA4_9ACTO|nr:GntR family transcriptional regulator [Arcanobacterium pinnipediorum]USR78902.1 GntR family transcriptional regulator [Arcanobacterium pinnipediorum]